MNLQRGMKLTDFIKEVRYKELDNCKIETGTYHPCDSCTEERNVDCYSIDYECEGCEAFYIIGDYKMFVIYEDYDNEFKIRDFDLITKKDSFNG